MTYLSIGIVFCIECNRLSVHSVVYSVQCTLYIAYSIACYERNYIKPLCLSLLIFCYLTKVELEFTY